MHAQIPGSPPDSIVALLRSQVHLDSMQVSTLRAEVGVLRETRNDVLGAANTGLGITLGLAALLVGFNWFSTGRNYRRDKEAIQKELESELSTRIEEIRTSTSSQIDEATKRGNDLIGHSVDNRVSEALEDTRQKLAGALAEMRGLRSELLDLRIAEKRSEARYWELQKVEGNELDRWLELLELLITNRREGHELTLTLSNIARLGRAGTLPFWAYVPRIVAFLDRISPQYQTEVAEIKGLLQKVPRA